MYKYKAIAVIPLLKYVACPMTCEVKSHECIESVEAIYLLWCQCVVVCGKNGPGTECPGYRMNCDRMTRCV